MYSSDHLSEVYMFHMRDQRFIVPFTIINRQDRVQYGVHALVDFDETGMTDSVQMRRQIQNQGAFSTTAGYYEKDLTTLFGILTMQTNDLWLYAFNMSSLRSGPLYSVKASVQIGLVERIMRIGDILGLNPNNSVLVFRSIYQTEHLLMYNYKLRIMDMFQVRRDSFSPIFYNIKNGQFQFTGTEMTIFYVRTNSTNAGMVPGFVLVDAEFLIVDSQHVRPAYEILNTFEREYLPKVKSPSPGNPYYSFTENVDFFDSVRYHTDPIYIEMMVNDSVANVEAFTHSLNPNRFEIVLDVFEYQNSDIVDTLRIDFDEARTPTRFRGIPYSDSTQHQSFAFQSQVLDVISNDFRVHERPIHIVVRQCVRGCSK